MHNCGFRRKCYVQETIPSFIRGMKHMATQQQRSQSSNQRLVPLAESALDQMKYEIASEFGVVLGGDTTSRENGSVGGEMTKRMVAFAEGQMAGRATQITH
jgi:small acid-soluble spore protein B (major beta-type SASP)